MAFTFLPHKIIFNDSTELTSAQLGITTRKLAQVSRTSSKTFAGISEWDDEYLSTTINTTTTQSIVYTCSFTLMYETGQIQPQIRFSRNSEVVYQPDYVIAWQHNNNKSTGNGQFMWLEEEVPKGTYTISLGLRNNGSGTTLTTIEHDNGSAADVLSVYYY